MGRTEVVFPYQADLTVLRAILRVLTPMELTFLQNLCLSFLATLSLIRTVK